MFNQISAAALFAGLAAAYHTPVGEPTGNPITRPLNEIVPACKPFSIEWTPTTSNKVSLVLLKGPSNNVVPLNAIVEGIANSGKFTWTPDAALEATTTPTGYGLQIIDDVNGQYQYSTQFGISKDGCAVVAASSSSNGGSKPTPTGYNTIAPPKPSETKTPAAPTTIKTSAVHGSSSTCTSSTTTVYVPGTTGAPVPVVPGNGTVIQPTKPISVPSSLKPSASAPANGTAPVVFPGAASGLQAGMGLAGFVAAVVAML
ncbi:hypothetical protein CC80DRAFT_493376 [Byssothecium circinans]|uniref:Yeast cell wall synthesis Kre9/Knh1-like N-terminal domain-containing protein n=1 Tax=Byssothecium circinans TaxID=147558 RepID=A0A6A5TQM9_9PLEO|nr:hypothetical protein CC80DRAFT_493376 [Byssothecium circinans]